MFTLFILNMLDYTFFLYNTYPRVNSTMKLIVILNMIITSFNKKYRIEKHNVDKFQQINIDLVLKKIQDEIILVLEKNKLIKGTQVETLYLLIVLEKVGDEYKLSQDSLIKYFNISQDTNGKLVFNNHLNTLSILVLLYYIKNDIRYQCIKDSLQDFIKRKYEEIHIEKRRSYSELILLIMDILTCPYLTDDYKKELLALCNITDVDNQTQVIKFHKGHKHWFIRWTDFNLGKELNAKISQEVYS